jgi:hypothetical protein
MSNPADQTVSVTNSGGGTLSGLSESVTYGSGQPVGWLTATLSAATAPATLTVHVSPTGINPGAYNATISVASAVAGNSPRTIAVTWTKSAIVGPVLAVPTVSGTSITLSWTYTWGPLGSTNDAYCLEQSTTSATTGFTEIATYATRTTPYSVTLTRSAGTYWYRVRANTGNGYTDYSTVRSAQVSTISATKFQNDAAWSIIYLTIDGVQQFTASPQGIAPGAFAQGTFSVGSHTYEARTGTWNEDGSRFEMYTYTGSFTQASGVIGTVTIINPTINQLLTRFTNTPQNWSGEWWGSDLSYHYRTFRFTTSGTFTLSDDGGAAFASGSYTLVTYNPGLVTFRVTYGGNSYDGILNEIYGGFYMNNGPASWTTIEYY